ncbi:hypothetical protein ASD98_06700 [Flavobacterium sp. Root186]|nr:hypothetical protein ASD98_06700 [Flavobacterium sp. Root186]
MNVEQTHLFVISRDEKSPQRESNLCRASREDFSFLEMTNGVLTTLNKNFASLRLCEKYVFAEQKNLELK